MKRIRKWMLCAVVLAVVVVFGLVYTRPRSLEQRYPSLDLAQCTEVKGYWFTAPGEEEQPFILTPTDARFEELLTMIQSARWRARLENLLPQNRKTHTYTAGDCKWELYLSFDSIPLPDGSAVSGYCLEISNFFGDLSICFAGETVRCSVAGQEQWARDVMRVVSQYPAE